MMDESKIINAYNKGITEVISLVKNMNTSLNGEIIKLKIDNKELTLRLKELEARINKNSGNSSKPPSSDGLKKIKNSREKSNKHTGGQPGHKGRTLEKIENPDEIIDLRPKKCECGCDLTNVISITQTRQVIEIPKIELKVTEYQGNQIECPNCHKKHLTEFPSEVTQPVQYGENLQGLMAYLTQYQFLPLARAAELVRDLTGHSISEGTLVNVNNKLFKNLENVENEIKEQIIASQVVHFDETGVRCSGKTNWLHSASTDKLTHYAVHNKRGTEATKEIDILPEFEGTAVHDHWKPYYTFDKCTHAECNAHNIRNLKDAYENFEQSWAKDMAGLLIEIKEYVKTLILVGNDSMSPEEILIYQMKYKSIISKGKEDNPIQISAKTGRPAKNAADRLLARLEKYDIETLSFMYDFTIPFDNNLAERDLRMIKLRQKISGCFRGEESPNVFCRIRGYISTCRKNGENVMESLVKAIKGDPYIPKRN
jgi:transposase